MAAIPVRTRWQATTLIAATLLGASAAPATEVFRWTDATGKVHFGDHPPEQGAAAMTIHSSAGGTDSGRRQQRTQRILDDFAHQRAEQAAMAQASAEKEATRDAHCAAARKERYRLEHANKLYRVNEDGERRVLAGAEYTGEIERARQAVEASCD